MKIDKPSTTALFVAHGMYYNTHQKHLKSDVPKDMAAYNAKLIDHVYGIKSSFAKRLKNMQCAIAQFFTIDGFYLHFLTRKKCIEKEALEAIKNGAKQVVALGAGYDTLCTRLAPQFPDVQFIELDHPATAKNKIGIFQELKWQHENTTYLSGDLMEIDHILNEKDLNKNLKTVFICEGVLMYIPENKISDLLQKLHDNFKEDSTFIFTFMEEDKPGNFQFKNAKTFVKLLLKIKGEPFSWGIPSIKLNAFTSKHGWDVQKTFDHHAMRKEFLSSGNAHLPLAIGENVAVCTKKAKH